MNDVEFLLKLVHRGVLLEEAGKVIFGQLQAGGDLDALLQHHAGLSRDKISDLRRTDAGERPEIPGYEILGKAGTGGTADVWRARERKTRRVIALKVLKPESTHHAPTLKAFVAEARLLEKLRHPGLVEGYGVARYGRVYFSRMEYVEGRTLLELLDELERHSDARAFDETAALRVVLSTAEVLSYLAGQGVVHRDIKPGNIMLSSDGRLKLIDLGFAAAPEDERGGRRHHRRHGRVPIARAGPGRRWPTCAATSTAWASRCSTWSSAGCPSRAATTARCCACR